MKTRTAVILAFSFLFIFTACSPFSKNIREGEVLGNKSGLKKVTSNEDALVYVRPGYDIGDYNKFRIDPVRIKSVGKDMSKLYDEDRKTLRSYLRKTVSAELIKGSYQVVTQSGSDIVGIRFTLTDVNAGNPYLNVIQFTSPGIAPDIGGVTIESEFYDTTNSQVNAITIVGAEGARKFNVSAVKGRWGDVKRIFDDWAEGFRKRVDDAHVPEDSAY
jgi:hypothetical protein